MMLSIIYLSNRDIFQHNDATANIYLAANIIQHNEITFTYEKYPFMFVSLADGSVRPNYYLTPVESDKTGKSYLNRFGTGSSLLLLPVFIIAEIASPGILNDHFAVWSMSKLMAAMVTAVSSVFIYMISLVYVRQSNAWIICMVYAIATSAWSYNSQTMFQHTSCNFFLLLGVFLLVRYKTSSLSVLSAALAFALACWCRPTCLVFVMFTGLYLLLNHPRYFLPFCLVNIASIAGMAFYNYEFTGSVLSFPQTHNTEQIAYNKTGIADVWQTPILTGLAGILFSPGRGLFIYSPVLLFTLYGIYQTFIGKKQYQLLYFLCLASFVILIIDSKWFDWWGGWCFGYRLIMESVTIFCLLLVPVIEQIRKDKLRFVVFLFLLSWSAFVQFIGAFAYDIGGWENRTSIELKLKNSDKVFVLGEYETQNLEINPDNIIYAKEHSYSIDRARYRYRLWAFKDSPIPFYIYFFTQARLAKIQHSNEYLESIGNIN